MNQQKFLRASLLCCGALAGCLHQTAHSQETPAATTVNLPNRPKKIFAHYMACWPAASGPMVFDFQNIKKLRHDAPGETEKLGGHVRNWSLPSPDERLSLHDSCDLEIRRAIEIGIDGFTIDAWAGGQAAKDTLDMLFTVAEEKNYPFEITITPDPNAVQGSSAVEAIKYLLEKHGNSPKLARRDGKPLIFGYQTIFTAMVNADQAYIDNPQLKGTWIWNQSEWRSNSKGWEYLGKAMQTLQEKVGQPLYLEFALEAFDFGIKGPGMNDDQKIQAAGILAKSVGAMGAWSWLGTKQKLYAETIRKNGAEWMYPIGLGQKENIPYESFGPPGLEWFHGGWKGVIGDDSTLLQYITWNDYGENSNLAPGFNTRYALLDLTGYYLSLWKNGKPPTYDHDKVYLAYHKYPKGAKLFPFKGKFPRTDPPALEVVTILTKPATIRLPGRNAEYEAPAGLFIKQFPNTPGAVSAEVVRGNKVTTRVDSPEPITDKPFREDNGIVSFSSEDARLWKADFGDRPMWTYSEYGDEDKDGLPNWFEMYWFGTWMDFSTQTIADLNADPDHDGRTNLQEYQDQTDPTLTPEEEKLKVKPPLEYIKHRARGEYFQPGSSQIPFSNGSFEKPGATPEAAYGWQMKLGAVRTNEKASEGLWSAKLPAAPGQPMTHILQALPGTSSYSWNSDALHPNALRSGCVVGYSVDVALEKDATPAHKGYMRLAHDPYAGGYEMWGPIPMISTDSGKFSRRFIAQRLSPSIKPGTGIGGTWGHDAPNAPEKIALYFDNFSPLTLLRPQLKIGQTGPLQLGEVALSATAVSTKITISNGQTQSLPQQLNATDPVKQVPTVLYGLASFKPDDKTFAQNITAPTDHVGAILIGEQASLFEFVSEHLGANPQELKLMGADNQPGLLGGPTPESEDVVVRFKGAPQAGKYAATVRIVTQAANTGTLSLLKPGEPPYNLFYVDIPVEVTVR